MESFTWCKELWTPKTFNRFSFMANVGWIAIGMILLGVFLDMEINESRFDFRCDANNDQIDKDFIRGKCFVQYEKQYSKLSVPLYGFVVLNFVLPFIVCVIYSQFVKSRVHELARNAADVEGQIQSGNSTPRKLFKAYCCQLATRLCLGILFIVLLQTQVFYPRNFPSNFECNFMREDNDTANATENTPGNTQTYECHNQRAHKKTAWVHVVSGANGILALVLLAEIVIILTRARKGKEFMEDLQFFVNYLKSNSDAPLYYPLRGAQDEQNQETLEEQQRQHSVQLQACVKSIKDNVIKGTERLRDLASPFQPNPGEGDAHLTVDEREISDGDQPKDRKLNQIYTNLVIYPGRAEYDFTGDRREQLKVYPKPEANLSPKRPQDIVDAQHKKILVVGRPGIGKTLFCTKLLQDWAQAKDEELYFYVAFLVKFRTFNSAADLDLRELLDRSEFSTPLNDKVWDYLLENPSKVLLIFDGIDEFNEKTEIAKRNDSVYRNTVDEKMPLHVLYNKVALGKLLKGATVLTTTRPTAVSCIRHLNFNRTVEILGFTSEQVEDYVKKFTEDDKGAAGTIWQHISNNLNIFSLCYIPVNSFIICSCLLHILKKLPSNSTHSLASLPTKLTQIYSFATKLFFFKHSERYRYETVGQDIIYEPFANLPDDVQGDFKKLEEIAFKGIKEGRLIFGSNEVTTLDDCGLLHRLPDLEAPIQRPFEKPKAQFCFMHLTIQEFLAAKHVTDTMNDAELREFVSGHINEGAWQVVMQFVAGLLSDPKRKRRDSSLIDIFTDLLPVSTTEKEEWELIGENEKSDRTLTCWPAEKDKHLALTLCMCLNEIDADNSVVQSKLRDICFNAVDFSRCSLAPADCTSVVNLLKNHKGMLSLNLRSSYIGWLGCKEIQKLFVSNNDNGNYCKLRSLNLSHNKIATEGVKHLVEALKDSYCKLNSLNLSSNEITTEGVNYLVEALKDSKCKLSSLNLSCNKITTEGVKHLAEALQDGNCKLSSLNLSCNGITIEVGVKYLSVALKDSNCKIIYGLIPSPIIPREKHLTINKSVGGGGRVEEGIGTGFNRGLSLPKCYSERPCRVLSRSRQPAEFRRLSRRK